MDAFGQHGDEAKWEDSSNTPASLVILPPWKSRATFLSLTGAMVKAVLYENNVCCVLSVVTIF